MLPDKSFAKCCFGKTLEFNLAKGRNCKLQAAGKIAANSVERGIDFGGKDSHTRNCAERNERYDKGILDQILTLFV
jgi:hypothetical protein